jgi:hypothetical protein
MYPLRIYFDRVYKIDIDWHWVCLLTIVDRNEREGLMNWMLDLCISIDSQKTRRSKINSVSDFYFHLLHQVPSYKLYCPLTVWFNFYKINRSKRRFFF